MLSRLHTHNLLLIATTLRCLTYLNAHSSVNEYQVIFGFYALVVELAKCTGCGEGMQGDAKGEF